MNVLPALTVAQQESQFGILNQTAPDRCCGMRKVGPLFASLEPYALWFTGLRREQAKTRANLQVVDTFTLPTGKQLQKISPLADWSTRDVWRLCRRARHPAAAALRQGLHQHWLRTMYQPAFRPQRPSLRPLGWT